MNLWNEWVTFRYRSWLCFSGHWLSPCLILSCSIYPQFFSPPSTPSLSPNPFFLEISLCLLNSQSSFLYLLLHWHLAVPWGHCILCYTLSVGSFTSEPESKPSWVPPAATLWLSLHHLLITPQWFWGSCCPPCNPTPPQPPDYSSSSTENYSPVYCLFLTSTLVIPCNFSILKSDPLSTWPLSFLIPPLLSISVTPSISLLDTCWTLSFPNTAFPWKLNFKQNFPPSIHPLLFPQLTQGQQLLCHLESLQSTDSAILSPSISPFWFLFLSLSRLCTLVHHYNYSFINILYILVLFPFHHSPLAKPHTWVNLTICIFWACPGSVGHCKRKITQWSWLVSL